jgi:FkbM family methyltransferase
MTEVVQPVPLGLSDRDATCSFETGGGGSSKVLENEASAGEGRTLTSIQVTSIDAFVRTQGLERVDLISLDIEGLEPDALNGAEETLRRFRPKLQISAYHHERHLFELHRMIEALDLGYRFYLGHHNTYFTETDLYAIA